MFPAAFADIILAGNNSWGGATKLRGGVLTVTGGHAIPDTSAVVFTAQTFARLQIVDDETIGSLASEGGSGIFESINLDVVKKLTVGTDNTSTTYLVVTGGIERGNLTKVGSGTLRFSGNQSWRSSGFWVKQGTVEVDRSFASWSASRPFVGDGSDTPASFTLVYGQLTSYFGSLSVDGSAAVLDLGRDSWSSTSSPVVLDHGGSITGASDRIILLTARVFDFRSGSVDVSARWPPFTFPSHLGNSECRTIEHGCTMKWRFVADPYGNWVNVLTKAPEAIYGQPKYDVRLYGLKARNNAHWSKAISDVVPQHDAKVRLLDGDQSGDGTLEITLTKEQRAGLKSPYLTATWSGAFDVYLNGTLVKKVRYNLPDTTAGWYVPTEAAKTLHVGDNLISLKLIGPGKDQKPGAPLSKSKPFARLGLIDWRREP
jgi:hypothetical protein